MSIYPLVSFYFSVYVKGMGGVDSAFMEASGFDAEREIQEVVEGGENRFVHRLPTRMKHGNLVLKRGFVGSATPLFDWCKATLESDVGQRLRPHDIKVSLLDMDGHPMVAWDFVRAWPVKMSVSNFNAKESEVAVETLEFSYAYLNRGFVRGNSGQGP